MHQCEIAGICGKLLNSFNSGLNRCKNADVGQDPSYP